MLLLRMARQINNSEIRISTYVYVKMERWLISKTTTAAEDDIQELPEGEQKETIRHWIHKIRICTS